MAEPAAPSRRALLDGLRTVSPLLVGVAPFGLIFGVTAAATSVGRGLGYATSLIIFAGAAQLATVQLLDAGAAAAVVIATGLVINVRHVMYSAALAPYFERFPAAWRFGLPYLLTDQAFAVSISRYEDVDDPGYQRWFFLGAAMGLWVTWQLTTAAGILLGAQVPEAWSLEFAIPLVFLALLVPSLRDLPSVAAALVGGVAVIAGRGLPYNLGLVVAALLGVVAGVLTHRMRR